MLIRRTPILLAALLAAACATAGTLALGSSRKARPLAPGRAAAAEGTLTNWLQFGLDPQRSDASSAATGISRAKLHSLHRIAVKLPGTADSSAIYIHGANVGGHSRNVTIVTTTYGRTVAIDADSGARLWTFTPAGYSSWAGSAQITTATPLAELSEGGGFVYAASPNGQVHKLDLATGAELHQGGWPVSVTRDATHEKIGPALNASGSLLLVATGGYIGDAPPYQGHVVAIDRATGHVRSVFNSLCANRARLIKPASCASSDSAIWSRAGAVVEPGGTKLLVTTGNGPWNGHSNFGDSALELSLPGLKLLQAFTPTDQEALNTGDTDLGSGGPAVLGNGEALVGGKDGKLRLLSLAHMDGRRPGSGAERLGGELQQLPTPGSAELVTEPCVWQHGGQTTVFVADDSATAAYALRGGRLHKLWEASTAGTSPLIAGGLLYVYNPAAGGIVVYDPASPHPIADLPGQPGHWNSPIVADGHVIEPEGNANDHALSGTLDILRLR